MTSTRIGAIDIGYGALKVLAPGTQHPLLIPSAVAPTDRVRIPTGAPRDEIPVVVDGTPYRVGEDAAVALGEKVARKPRHSDYIHTPEYRALLYAGLSVMDTDSMDVLVTGLPVEHFRHQHQALRDLLVGAHTIRPGQTVTVKEAYVIPQPMGGMLSHLDAEGASAQANEAIVLVYDPGYGTMDWVLFNGITPVGAVSGSSRHGFGQIFDLMSDRFADQYHGARPARQVLERAVREGREHILVGSRQVELQPALASAAAQVSRLAVDEMRNALDDRISTINRVVGVGGGAPAYQDAVRAILPDVDVRIPKSPVFDIVRGYRIYGRAKVAHKAHATIGG